MLYDRAYGGQVTSFSGAILCCTTQRLATLLGCFPPRAQPQVYSISGHWHWWQLPGVGGIDQEGPLESCTVVIAPCHHTPNQRSHTGEFSRLCHHSRHIIMATIPCREEQTRQDLPGPGAFCRCVYRLHGKASTACHMQ